MLHGIAIADLALDVAPISLIFHARVSWFSRDTIL